MLQQHDKACLVLPWLLGLTTSCPFTNHVSTKLSGYAAEVGIKTISREYISILLLMDFFLHFTSTCTYTPCNLKQSSLKFILSKGHLTMISAKISGVVFLDQSLMYMEEATGVERT